MAQDIDASQYDKLGLAKNEECRAMIAAEGDKDEIVVYSEKLVKINRKGKKQDRVLLLTNKAVYNMKPKKYKQSMRRVELKLLGMLTLSSTSPEFAIHVPTEYDYHLASKNKQVIAELLKELYSNATKGKLMIIDSDLKHLKDIILTKKLAAYEQQADKQDHNDQINKYSSVDPYADSDYKDD